MRAYVNELALAESCGAVHPDVAPLEALLEARYRQRALAGVLYCSRGMSGAVVRSGVYLRDVAARLPRDKRNLFFRWTDSSGPFFDENRQTVDQDLFLFGDDEVTDLGLGEAARQVICSFAAATLSLVPSQTSRFAADPLIVNHGLAEEPLAQIPVPNYVEATKLVEAVEKERREPTTWAELLAEAREHFVNLCIGEHCDRVLARETYRPHQGRRILQLLDVLHKMKAEMGEDGGLSPVGNGLHSDFFIGQSAWFTDESSSRKERIPEKFIFPNPSGAGRLTCFWHGKIHSDGFRMHFDWPVSEARERLRVVYIGPHID